MNEEFNRFWLWLQKSGVTILLILVGAVIAYFIWEWVIRLIVRRIQALDDIDGSEMDKRTETIGNVLHSAGIVVVLATAILMILPELGINITPILASVGIVGLAAGLGAQTLVKDMISGMFILIENQYTVGDVVEINGVTGPVEGITLRVTMVRDLTGTLHTIPMGEIRKVANKTRDWSRAVVDVSITYDEEVDTAVRVLEGITAVLQTEPQFQDQLLEEAVVTGIEGLDDWAVRLRVMVKTVPGVQWNVQRWLRRQIRDEFAQQKIELAFPRQDVMIVNAADMNTP
ncbi:MAG: mechanosensitive ion channel family protein [Chloroflexi bacterium]|nr:mechanosensitive ion channel family protein [Chloroflexota bacterium]